MQCWKSLHQMLCGSSSLNCMYLPEVAKVTRTPSVQCFCWLQFDLPTSNILAAFIASRQNVFVYRESFSNVTIGQENRPFANKTVKLAMMFSMHLAYLLYRLYTSAVRRRVSMWLVTLPTHTCTQAVQLDRETESIPGRTEFISDMCMCEWVCVYGLVCMWLF